LLKTFKGKEGVITVSSLITYILKVHPWFWTVFGNQQSFDDKAWDISTTKPVGNILFYQSCVAT